MSIEHPIDPETGAWLNLHEERKMSDTLERMEKEGTLKEQRVRITVEPIEEE